VALIRTDVSEDRIASIFRVTEYEQVQSETVSSCTNGDSRNTNSKMFVRVCYRGPDGHCLGIFCIHIYF
jgi:hypothetical protein